jgi:hypothetical protein
MKRKFILPILALFLIGTLHSQTIDYQVTPGSNSKNNAGTFIGQSFTSGATVDYIQSLDMYINSSLLGVADFTLSLYAVTGTAQNYVPTGGSLHSITFSNSILESTVGTHYLFEDLNWSITDSTTYMVGIESETIASVKWQASATSLPENLLVGTDGQNRYSNAGVVSGSLYAMTVTTAAIPEPSAYALIAGAFFLTAAIYRRCFHRSAP